MPSSSPGSPAASSDRTQWHTTLPAVAAGRRGSGTAPGKRELTSAAPAERATRTAASSSAEQPGGEGDGDGGEQQPGGVSVDLERWENYRLSVDLYSMSI